MEKQKEIKPKYCKNKNCVDCGTKDNVQHVPNLYDSDVKGIHDPVYICDRCNYESGQDI